MSEQTAPGAVRTILGLSRYAIRATFRNKVGYFFSLVFPLLFVISFGFAGGGRHRVRFGVSPALPADSAVRAALAAAAEQPHALVELVSGTETELAQLLSRGKLAAIVNPGAGPHAVELVTTDAAPAARTEAETVLAGVLSAANSAQSAHAFNGRTVPGRVTRHIDFVLPGQIGFSMLSLATFGMGFTLMTLRKTLVIKRILATTVPPLQFVVALGISRSVQAIFQSAVLLAVGAIGFRFQLAHGLASALQVLLLAYVGILGFLGFGILIANLARDEQTLPVVMNMFTMPQILICGVFFPTEDLPGLVRVVGENLPLAYLNTALRMVALDGASILQTGPQLLGMSVWGGLAYWLAARTFKAD